MKHLVLIITICLSAGARAKVMTLEECLTAAYEHNLQLKAEQIAVEKSRLLIGTAFDIPNTGVELAQDATEGGGMDNGITISQEFDFPTIYIAKRKALKADYSVARGQLEEKKNELCGQVFSAYYTLLFSHRKVGVLECLSATYADFVNTAHVRYKEGEASRLECMNADRMKAKIDMELRQASLELNSNALNLMTLTGTEEPIEPAESDLQVLEMTELTDDFIPEQTYSGKTRELELRLSERKLSVAKQDFLPGISLSATTQMLINGFNPYNIHRERFEKGNFMGFSVGLTLPLFFGTKRANLLAARRDLEIAQMRIEEERVRLNKEYAEAKNEYLAARQALSYYEQTGLGQANEIARLAKVSYELGEIDYMEYIQNIETATAVELEYLESIERYNQSIIKLKTIKGTI